MSQANMQPLSPAAGYGANGGSDVLSDLRAVRDRVVEAWQGRGVMLTFEEQCALRDEINATCALLTDLTSSS